MKGMTATTTMIKKKPRMKTMKIGSRVMTAVCEGLDTLTAVI